MGLDPRIPLCSIRATWKLVLLLLLTSGSVAAAEHRSPGRGQSRAGVRARAAFLSRRRVRLAPGRGEKRRGCRRLRGVLLMYRDVRMSGPRKDARLGQVFWLLFFAQAKKSKPPAAREPHLGRLRYRRRRFH